MEEETIKVEAELPFPEEEPPEEFPVLLSFGPDEVLEP